MLENAPELPMRRRRLSIEVTNACNFKCVHCYNRPPSPDCPASIDLDAICRIVDEAYQLDCRDVLLTGGEPMLWPHFAALYEHISLYDDLSVKLNTNASLVNVDIANLLSRRPPSNIHVGLYGWDEESYSAITGNPAAFASVTRGISLLAQKGLKYYLLIPGIRRLAENKDKMDAFAGNLGSEMIVRDWMLGDHVYRDEVKNAEIRRVRLSPKEAARGQVGEKGGCRRILDEFLKPPPRDYDFIFSCVRNYKQVIIDPHLNLLPCIILRHPDYIFSLVNSSLSEGLEFLKQISKITHKRTDERDRCGDCRIRGLCRHCPANAFLEHGDFEGIGEYYCEVSHEIAAILGL